MNRFTKIERQDIGFDQFEISGVGEFILEFCNQISIELDCDQATGFPEKFSGQRSVPGADFDHRLIGLRPKSLNDLLRDCAIDEKVLPKAALGRGMSGE
jgi:hypothetical protein